MSYMKNGAKVEGWIRKELGESSPIPWTADKTGERSFSEKRHDAKVGGLGGNLDIKNWYYFDLPGMRPTRLTVSIITAGYLGTVVPSKLFYETKIAKPTSSGVYLYKEGLLRPKFMFKGDQQICDKLNCDENLIKLSSHFYNEKAKSGNVTLRTDPIVSWTG